LQNASKFTVLLVVEFFFLGTAQLGGLRSSVVDYVKLKLLKIIRYLKQNIFKN